MKIFEKDFSEAFNATVTAGTNGIHGPDDWRKTITEITLKHTSALITYEVSQEGFKIIAQGDSELDFLCEMFAWIGNKLFSERYQKRNEGVSHGTA